MNTDNINTKKNRRNKYFYCYNHNQARYFKENGVDEVDIGKHKTTGNVYWVFIRGRELEEVFNKWNNRNK